MRTNYKVRIFSLLIFIIALSGCNSLSKTKTVAWPESLPKSSYFVNHLVNRTQQRPNEHEVSEYLNWVKRFYIGSRLYNNGWLDISDKVVNSVKNSKNAELANKNLERVGKNIAVEWALDNEMRNITTANVITWGNVLEKSIERNEQLILINKVEQDVLKLTNGQLSSLEIIEERYYLHEDYDDF